MNNQSQGCVLVFRTGQLGDTIVSMPAINEIVARNLEKNLIFLTDSHKSSKHFSSWDILNHTGWFESVLFYPASDKGIRQWFSFLDLLRHIRKLKPGKIYYLSQSRRSRKQIQRDYFFFHYICGIKECIGFSVVDHPKKINGLLPRIQSQSARLLEVVTGKGEKSAREFRFIVPEADKKKAREILAAYGLFTFENLITLCPGSKRQSTRWPIQNYAELCQKLLDSHPELRFMILGSAEDRELGQDLVKRFAEKTINLAGRTSILESAALLEMSLFYLGNDTGLMHLAAAIGLKCVVIFSARDYPGEWEPMGNGHIIFRHEVECAGCILETCIERNLICLTRIEPSDVFKRIIKHFSL